MTLPLPLFASEWDGKVIHQIRFDSAPGLSAVEFFQRIDLRPGDRYRAGRIRRAIQRLYETGKFKDIWVEVTPLPDGEILVQFRLVPKRIFSSLHLSGNHFLSEKEIFEAMSLKPGGEFTEARWQKALAEIISLYHRAGYFQATFSVEFKRDPENERGIDVFLRIDEGSPTKIRSLSFRGNKVFSDLTLNFAIKSRKREFYRFKDLEDDLRSLERFYAEKGYLKAIVGPPEIAFIPKTNEVDIVVPVEAFNRIEVFFENSDPFPPERLRKLLLIKEERSDEDDVLDESARQIEKFYRGQGYPFAKVRAASKRFPDKNRMEAHFRIERGPRTRIRAVVFSGNITFTAKRLRGLVRLQEERRFRRSLYTEERLRDDAAALTAFYKKEGFRDVRVSPDVPFDPSRTFATIVFKIDEGVRTRIGQAAIEGNRALSEETLKKGLPFQSGSPYNETVVKEGERRLVFLYQRQGYLYVRIDSSVRLSEDRTAADVAYPIVEGEQVRLGRVQLEGNLRTQDRILLREMALREGDPFDPEKILESQRRLYQTGLFSGARFDPIHPEEKPALQDVKLSVVERPNVAMQFGVGYADYERFRGFFEVSHRNLWGTNRQITARADGSRIEERYTLNYKEPWFFSRTIDARLGAGYIIERELAFDLRTLSGTAGIDKSFSDTLKGSFLYQYESNKITHIEPGAQIAPEDFENRIAIASLNPSLIRDTRDDPFNPRRGSVNGIAFRDAAKLLGSEAQFVKTTLQSSWYFPLSQKWVFALSGRAGVAQRFGESVAVPVSERFLAGGRSTVRGYDQDKLGIPGKTLINNIPRGGDALLIFNEELRIALPKSFGLVLFFDHGNVWLDHRDVKFSEIKSTTGAGLRYNTPVGPLRLDWGYKLNREAGEGPWALHFTLGHAF